jgi:hypothetical protein
MKLFSIFLLTLVPFINSYPFNNSECVQCIEGINYIHANNNSIKHIANEFNSFCDYYNISGCHNLTNYGISLINQNSTIICEELGYCDTLNMDSFAFDCNPYNVTILRYYDLLLGYRVDVLDNVLNYTKLWTTKIAEPYTNISLLSLDTHYNIINYPSYTGCDVCFYDTSSGAPVYPAYDARQQNSILKVSTENYIYYMNITSGLVYDKLVVHSHRKTNVPMIFDTYQYPSSVLDHSYNGSLYNIDIDVSSTQSQCNYTSPDNPIPTLANCLYNTINSISMSEMAINLPTVPPRCATALEMYCPHNIGGRENCLNCLVKKQPLLKTCSIIEEEHWCNKF